MLLVRFVIEISNDGHWASMLYLVIEVARPK